MTSESNRPLNANDISEIGVTVRIQSLRGHDQIVQRLRELGLHPGIEVEYVGQAPFAGPRILRVGATLIALRSEEAACVQLLP